MAKRERDGWRVEKNNAHEFSIGNGVDWLKCVGHEWCLHISMSEGYAYVPPARAAQFAAKVAAIAARAAKEAKDGR